MPALLAAEAVSVVLLPKLIGLVPTAIEVESILAVTLLLKVQPFIVPCTVKVVVRVGAAVTLAVVELGVKVVTGLAVQL